MDTPERRVWVKGGPKKGDFTNNFSITLTRPTAYLQV